MPTQTWPAELPQKFSVNGYQETFADPNIAAQPNKGPPIVRPRTSANVRPWRLNMTLHSWQVDLLDNFFYVTLYKGVWPFIMPHPRKNGQPLLDATTHLPLFTSEGVPILVTATALMQFVVGQPPVITPLSPVTFNGAISLNELP